MKYGPLIFLAAFFALATSWFGLVFKSQEQLGRAVQSTNTISQQLYPQARPGQAHQGAEVYRANGCFYCHSQQIGQSGTVCDVILTDMGTNRTMAADALVQANPALAKSSLENFFSSLPQPVLKGVDRVTADFAVKAFKPPMKAELHIVPFGTEIARGWGKRRTVAEDYLYDTPVMLGSQRIGPDLSNVGARQSDANWQLRHLYSPKAVVTGSTMPSFKFLFETKKIVRVPSPDALTGLTGDLAPRDGYEIVPTPEAHQLVAYLLSMKADAPLYDAPYTAPFSPPATTNSVAAATNAVATK
jgi:cbb3-type cytochrome oxidase cytochrome c subunit